MDLVIVRTMERHLSFLRSAQGQGLGRAMHTELAARAKVLGARGVIVDSWTSAVGFYETLGYRVPGATFMIRSLDE